MRRLTWFAWGLVFGAFSVALMLGAVSVHNKGAFIVGSLGLLVAGAGIRKVTK